MKKKIFAALLMAGALAVVPCGNLFSMMATASTNNSANSGSGVTASNNNTVGSGSNVTASNNNTVGSGSNVTASNNNTVSPGSGSTGSGSTGSSSAGSSSVSNYRLPEARFINVIAMAAEGSTVTITRDMGINTLSNAFMKALLRRGDVTLVLECSYKGVDYTIVIPAGEALDNDIPWYGPLYLLSVYGDGTSSEADTEVTLDYIVQANDTMNKIAKKNDMTLQELVKLNPQITNVNRIRVGQSIRIK